MDDFKNSTKTHYMKGGSCDGYAKGGSVRGAAKINKVMGEFKAGKLHSGSKEGPEVSNRKQAVAIALSEARKAGAKVPMKKAYGGAVERGNRMQGEEARESVLAGGKPTGIRPRPKAVTVKTTEVTEDVAPRSSLDRRLGTLPSQRGEMRSKGVKPFSVDALVSSAKDALGLKRGGLASMPRGKKC